jgi:hypothetical protein
MNSSRYESLVKDLCQVAGLDDYHAVVDSRHIEVDGHVVGLIHDEDDLHSNELSIYVELDTVVPMSGPDLYLRLLQANVERRRGLRGHFGVHPETGHATYCLQVEAGPELEGAVLVDLLHAQVCGAASVLEQSRL